MKRIILLFILLFPALGGCARDGEWSFNFRIGPKPDFETADEALKHCVRYMSVLMEHIQEGAVPPFEQLISNEERIRTVNRIYCEPAKEREYFGLISSFQGWIEWTDRSRKYPESYHTKKESPYVNTFWWNKSYENRLKFTEPSVVFPTQNHLS